MEFALLRTVGAARGDGILQGELGRLTKQDKRSVPKRTDALRDKGYVVKQPAYHRGHKTSQIILRRFALNQINSSLAEQTPRLLDLARQILTACKEYPFITQDDLAQLLSIATPSKRRLFDQVIKHLVRRECLKKVKTAFAPDSATADLRLTLQYLRTLEDADLEKKDDDLVDLNADLDATIASLAEADVDSEEEIAELEEEAGSLEQQSTADSSRPSWNPDRSLPNVLYDFATVGGEHGITNVSARQQITGLTVKRPVESTLVRLCRSTLLVQPSSVHDLALVRTNEGEDSVYRFVHRSLESFSHMVDKGESSWSAIEGGPELAKHFDLDKGSDALNTSKQDEFGFAQRNKPARQVNEGRFTLEDIANAPGTSETVIMRPGEATITTDSAGNKTLSMRPERVSNISTGNSKTPKRRSCIVTLKLKPKLSTMHESEPSLQQPDSIQPQSEPLQKQSGLIVPQPEPEPTLQQLNPTIQQLESTQQHTEPELQHSESVPATPQLESTVQQAQPLLQQPEPILQKSRPTPKTPRPKKKQDGDVTKTLGRPRKFLQGTEEYWRILFWVKRHGSDWEIPKTTKQTGLMSDPDCLKMFAERPEQFDETLVRAMHQELPLPRTPASINATWVSKTNEFLDRSGVGAFYVPSGSSDLRHNEWSCPVIIRSTRLRQVDTTARGRPASVLFLTSSAAHSFRHHRSLQWYLNRIRIDAEEKSTSTTEVDRSTQRLIQVVQSREESYKSQDEEGGEGRTVDHTPRSNLVFINNFSASDPRPISAPTPSNSSVSIPVPSRKSTAPSGRAQRQRRPTQKALESAQSFVSTELDTEISGNAADVSGNAHANSKTFEMTPSPSLDQQFPSFETTTADITASRVADAAGTTLNFIQIPRPSSPTATFDSKSNKDEVHHLNEVHVSESTRETPEHTGVGIETTASGSIRDSSVPVTIQETNPPDIEEGSQETHIGPTSPDASTSNGLANSEPATAQPLDTGTDLAIDSAPLQLLVGRYAVPYYKKFLVELVYMCGGVVPHDPSLLKRAMSPKCVEAHVESNMNIKLIKSCISQLTQGGKLKVLQFAFQRNGFNHTKAIIALPNTQPNDQLFLAMQTKISLLPVNVDYVPPELEKEANRKPQGILRHRDSPILGARTKPKVKPTASVRPKRQSNQSEPGSGRDSSLLRQQPSLSPAPPEVSLNNGFLTLKVPGIARIQTDKAFTSNYFSLPAQPLIFDPSTPAANLQSPPSGVPSAQRNGNRPSRRSTVNGGARTVQWRVPKYTPLPTSIRAILAYDSRANGTHHNLSINPALEAFDKDVDFVAAWEQKHFDDLQEPKPKEWSFINHLSIKKEFIGVRREGDLQFRQVTFSPLHEEVETDLPDDGSWEVFAEILAKEASKSKKANESKAKRKRKAQIEFFDGRSNDEDEELSDFNLSGDEPRRKRQKGPTHKWYRKPRIAGTENDRRRHKRNHNNPRGIGLRDIPKALAHRITTAIVVVRVLTGGLDKYLDWKLVARLVPGEPESMLQSRWRTLSTRYNNDFDAMVQDLQIKYLDALADDRVPSVNYDDLNGTDWEGIHAWAVANINAEGKSANMAEIPPSREEFLELNSAEVGEPISVRHLHNISLQYTQATKEDFWYSVVFGTRAESIPAAAPKHIEACFPAEDDEANVVFARARSWVFAAVVTPHQSFDPHSAHAKLRRLAEDKRECEQLIDSTLKKLQSDKMVVTKDSADAVIVTDGTTLSGTYDWKLSFKFLDRFETNRYITSKMLKQAVMYKVEVLDSSFARGEPVVLPGDPVLEDGVMVSIFNLMNAGMLQLEPGADMPATRYGVDGESEGYQTRTMDKKNLFFSIVLKPTSTYVLGDISRANRQPVAIPRGDMDQEDGLGLIPMWFDINHDFRADMWDMVVGAIAGLISCRPGASTLQLVRTLDHVLSQKDLGMITQYLFDRGMIEKTCTGWETTETWWFAVGTGTENETQDGV